MANYKFKPALTEVKMIRKERLSEREFYHRIMEAIYRLGDTEYLSEEEAKQFQDALRKHKDVLIMQNIKSKRKQKEILLHQIG